MYIEQKKKVSSFPIKNLQNALQYFLKLSMIIVCKTSDYNMLKHCHQNFNLPRVIFATPNFNKFVTKVGLCMRRNKFCFAINSLQCRYHFTNKVMGMT